MRCSIRLVVLCIVFFPYVCEAAFSGRLVSYRIYENGMMENLFSDERLTAPLSALFLEIDNRCGYSGLPVIGITSNHRSGENLTCIADPYVEAVRRAGGRFSGAAAVPVRFLCQERDAACFGYGDAQGVYSLWQPDARKLCRRV